MTNGYCVFSEEDVKKLKKIAILREISDEKFLEISALKEKHKLMKELASNNNSYVFESGLYDRSSGSIEWMDALSPLCSLKSPSFFVKMMEIILR